MGKGTVIYPKRVKEFKVDEKYSSKMLIDKYNSDSQKLQVNQGMVNPGCKLDGAIHKPPYDELYIIMDGKGILHMDGVDYSIKSGDVVFIPGGTFHALENTSGDNNLVIITVWSMQPEKGVNGVYDMRLKEWGSTFLEK